MNRTRELKDCENTIGIGCTDALTQIIVSKRLLTNIKYHNIKTAAINNQETVRRAGLIHEGSLRAENSENEDSKADFDAHCSIFFAILPGLTQQRKTNSFRRARFSLDI